jgi:hypothetical protein
VVLGGILWLVMLGPDKFYYNQLRCALVVHADIQDTISALHRTLQGLHI